MWTLQDAKNKFSAVVDAALAETPQEITRRGRPAVVVMSAASYEQLLAEARTSRGSFLDHLQAMPGRSEADEPRQRAQVSPRDVML